MVDRAKYRRLFSRRLYFHFLGATVVVPAALVTVEVTVLLAAGTALALAAGVAATVADATAEATTGAGVTATEEAAVTPASADVLSSTAGVDVQAARQRSVVINPIFFILKNLPWSSNLTTGEQYHNMLFCLCCFYFVVLLSVLTPVVLSRYF